MENNMKLFNTLTKKVETFIPNEEGKVNMYTCGPTVYHFAHIGNLRSYIMEDVLEKTFRYAGYDVKRVMNITDVGHLSSDADTGEDKMLKGAKREHKTVMEIAKFYTDAFFSDCEKLNIKFVVVEGATRDNIRATIGHITGTAGMGGKGNCVLAGHRGGYYGEFFENIDRLEKGDTVILTDTYNRSYTYKVYKQFVVEPTETWICDPVEGEDTLTLLSCEENGTKRIIVRCRLEKVQQPGITDM